MRKYTLAVVGIVATLTTFSQAAQLSARTLSTSLVNVDSALIEKIASQVEDSFWSKVKVYAEHDGHTKHPHHSNTEHHDNQTAAEASHHFIPQNVLDHIGKYIKAELKTDRPIDALASAIKVDAEWDFGGVQNFFHEQAKNIQDHFKSEIGSQAVSE